MDTHSKDVRGTYLVILCKAQLDRVTPQAAGSRRYVGKPSETDLELQSTMYLQCQHHSRRHRQLLPGNVTTQSQELIAPAKVYFYGHDWVTLGSKTDLIDELEVITTVPESILRDAEKLRIASVAQNMSWAAERQSTHVEDQAHCLLAIFEVNLPLLYGEERKAFQRLQA